MSMPYPSSNYPQYPYTPNPNPGYAVPGAPRNDIPTNQNPYGQNFVPNYSNVVPVPIQTGFSCRPVTSKEEAVAFQIPFDGSTTYFVNTSTGEIYSKAYNFTNGSAPIETYVKKPPVEQASQSAPSIPDYSPMFNALGERLDYVVGQVNEIVGKLDSKPIQQSQRQMQNAKAKGNEK